MPHTVNILVVDDDRAILETVAACLGDEGYHVAMAHSADEALPMLREGRFALVLTDALVQMRESGMDYWETVERIRAAAGDIPVVLLSGHAAARFAQLEERGFAGLLPKPFELDELCDTVQRIIERSRSAGVRT
jgi:CheY-like chemotaxis protein